MPSPTPAVSEEHRARLAALKLLLSAPSTPRSSPSALCPGSPLSSRSGRSGRRTPPRTPPRGPSGWGGVDSPLSEARANSGGPSGLLHVPGSPGAVAHAAALWKALAKDAVRSARAKASSRSLASSRWRAAARDGLRAHRAQEAAHSWVALDTPTEKCVKHDFDAATGVWTTTDALCKLEATPFASGAMRSCYRLLKARCGRLGRSHRPFAAR